MKTKITLILAASIGASCPAMAVDRNDVLAVVATTTSLQRAAQLCQNYDFSAHEANFTQIILNARAFLGDAAVDAKNEEAGKAVSDLITMGEKEKCCDLAKNWDLGLHFGDDK